jgi:hypothetical protein
MRLVDADGKRRCIEKFICLIENFLVFTEIADLKIHAVYSGVNKGK